MPKKRDRFKALITADLHLSNGLPHAKPTSDGRTDRFEDQLRVLKQIKEIGIGERVDAVFILGDVFDKRLLDAVTLRYSLEAFRDLAPLDIWILPGNHDAHSEVAERFVSEIFREGVTGMDHLHFLDFGAWRPEVRTWLTFWCLPYSSLDVARQRLSTIREEIEFPKTFNADILLMHQSVIGSEHLAWVCDSGLTVEEVTHGFNYVFAGHFHKKQQFSGGDAGCYIGEPMQLNFGEEGYPAELHVATFEKNSPGLFKLQSFETDAPKFYTFSSFEDKDIGLAREGDYLKIQIEATHAEWTAMQADLKAKAKIIEEGGTHVKLVHKVVYHHEERLADDDAEVGDMAALISGYVDATEVVTEGVGVKTLKKLGLELLEEARAMERGGA